MLSGDPSIEVQPAEAEDAHPEGKLVGVQSIHSTT